MSLAYAYYVLYIYMPYAHTWYFFEPGRYTRTCTFTDINIYVPGTSSSRGRMCWRPIRRRGGGRGRLALEEDLRRCDSAEERAQIRELLLRLLHTEELQN